MKTIGRFTIIILSVVATFGPSHVAYARDCGSSPLQVISSNYTLGEDFTTNSTSTPCISVRNGKNVNLNGYKISCTNGSGCAPAIDCSGDAVEGSLIQSTVATDPTHVDIEGKFSIAVNECKQVKNLKIDGADTAIANSAKSMTLVQGNVISTCGDVCIDAKMTSDTNNVTENHLTPGGADAVHMIGKTSGSNGAKVDHNLITDFAEGIFNSDTTIFRVEDNVLFLGASGSTPISVGSGATKTNNVCEDDSDCACDLFDSLGRGCLAP